MDDTQEDKIEKKGEESSEPRGGTAKTGDEIDIARESEDVDIGDSKTVERRKSDVKEVPKVAEEVRENPEENKTETIMSSQSLKSSNPSISIPNDHATAPPTSTSLRNVKEKRLNRNQSDILPSLREMPRDEDPSMMIFSSKGLPTRKYFRRREVNSTILPFGFNEKHAAGLPPAPRMRAEAELTPKISQRAPKSAKPGEGAKKIPFGDKNPNVPNPSVSRNVLTGLGVSSQEFKEFKNKSMRRKDGNPVLGEGYDEPVVASTIGRVPPGGFSSGLW